MAAVELSGLAKRFGDQPALRDVDLQIAAGEFFSLLGPSGCGKTTTLRLIAGLEDADQGRIVLAGKDVTALPAHRRPIAMVFQNYALFPHLSVARNVAYGLAAHGVPRRERAPRVAAALARVALDGLEQRRVDQLSGGQQQRVALARAVVLEAPLLLLDEPLSNLDAALRVETRGMLRALQQELGLTAVYVTHDQEEALAISDRLAVLCAGQVQQVGAPETLYQEPANAFVASFLGRANLLPADLLGPTEAGLWRVRLASGDEALVRAAPASRPGRGRVLWRPEDLHLGAAGWAAEVAATTYLGAWREIRATADGVAWTVLRPAREVAPRRGERVWLGAPPGAGWWLAEGDC
ncbi:MAG: ABC transporter ATP-binding protein [Fimbriimonadaceae bacterium]|nr:ABC transporter ATP-binding protein [Fimbriimonadaceae bacterium]